MEDDGLKFRRNPEEKKEIILEVFTEMVMTQGYNQVSTNKVAKAAGVSIGTVYKYFPEGKSDLFKIIYDRNVEPFVTPEEYGEFLKMMTELDRTKMDDFVERYYEGHKEFFEYHKAFDVAISTNKDFFVGFQDEIKATIRSVVPIIKAAPGFDKIESGTIFNAIYMAITALESLVHQHLFYTPILEDEDEMLLYFQDIFAYTLQRNITL